MTEPTAAQKKLLERWAAADEADKPALMDKLKASLEKSEKETQSEERSQDG